MAIHWTVKDTLPLRSIRGNAFVMHGITKIQLIPMFSLHLTSKHSFIRNGVSRLGIYIFKILIVTKKYRILYLQWTYFTHVLKSLQYQNALI